MKKHLVRTARLAGLLALALQALPAAAAPAATDTEVKIDNFEYFCSLHPHMTGTIVVETTIEGAAAP